MRATTLIRSAAAAALIAVMLVAPASTAPAATGVEIYCNPAYPGNKTYDLLPPGSQVVTGTITGGDGGPWQVAVQSDEGLRTEPQTTEPDGSFSIPVDLAALDSSLGGGRLVIDGRWETGAFPSRTITLPPSTSITVTALNPQTGAPLPGARVLAHDLGVFEAASPAGIRYLGREDGAALIQGFADGSGNVTLPDIPLDSRVTLFACLDGQIDAINADVSGGARAFTMPSDADGVIGLFEDGADGDVDGSPDGDGNQDGLRDSLQSNVATLPVDPEIGPFLTVAAPVDTVLRGVTTSSPPIDPPPGTTLPFGLVGFRLTGIDQGSTHLVTFHLPSVDGVAGYLKYLPDTQSWGVMPSDRVALDPSANTVVLTLTDGGIGDRDGQANGMIDDPGGPYAGVIDPGDGIDDSLQPDGTPEFAFRDTSTTPETYGRLVDSNGLTGRITDAADPTKGVLVTVDPREAGTGSGPAELEVCGATVLIEPGSQVVLTCASIIVSPITGSATVVLDNGDTVTVAAGSSAEIEDTPDGVTLSNVSGGGVTVTINGETINVPDGSSPVAYPLPDTEGPTVTVTFDPPPSSGWYTSFPTGTVTATDPSGIAEIYCQPGGARLSNVTGLNTPNASATVTVEQDGKPPLDCYARDTKDNYGGEEIDIILQIDTTPPVVEVVFPGPPTSGWFDTSPVDGYVNVRDDSLVTDVECVGAELVAAGAPVLPLQNGTQLLQVSDEGVNEVSCTATNGAGLSGAAPESTSTATVRIDVGNDRDLDPADGIPDALQPPGTPEFEFRDTTTTPDTYGRLVDSNGLTGRITDATDPAKGVLVTVDPRVDGTGAGPAELEVCGSTVLVEPGSQVVLTCSSIIVSPISGSATVVLDNGDTITVPAGSSATILDTPNGVTLINVTGDGTTATINGETINVPDGTDEYVNNAWLSTFRAPVDNIPVLNSGKAGRAVPLKWHLSNSRGEPVTDLASATITVTNLDCASGSRIDVLETTLSVGGTLQNLGNGNYQLDWKTLRTWAGSCKVMTLDLGPGITRQAHFAFTR